jgi:threonyl-tRNA synthetase
VQVLVLPVADQNAEPARLVAGHLRAAGLRADCDPADATLGGRIRRARGRRIPYVVVIGDREASGIQGAADDGRVALRLRDGRQLDGVPVARLISEVSRQLTERSAGLGFDA